MKTSSDLLTEESYLYVRTVIILGGSLGVFTLSGLLWHFCFYKKTISPQHIDPGMKYRIFYLIPVVEAVILSSPQAEYFLVFLNFSEFFLDVFTLIVLFRLGTDKYLFVKPICLLKGKQRNPVLWT